MSKRYRRFRVSSTLAVGWLFADLLLALAMIFLIANTLGIPAKAKATPTPTPTPMHIKPTPTPEPRLELSFHRLNYTGIDYQGLLSDSVTAKNDLKQRFRNEGILQGRRVGLAIAYAGAPDTSLTDQASNISGKVYQALRELGQENFAFQRASYYDNLYVLGNDPGNIIIDVYLFK